MFMHFIFRFIFFLTSFDVTHIRVFLVRKTFFFQYNCELNPLFYLNTHITIFYRCVSNYSQ